MPSLSDTSEKSSNNNTTHMTMQKRFSAAMLRQLPLNVYLLLFFTLGKGFQITISTLNLNYYAHSLGYGPAFIGLFSAASAIGSMLSAVPVGLIADRIGRKPVLVFSALLTPLCLAATGLVTTAPLLLLFGLLQGFTASAYWVTNLPLLTESTSEQQRVGVLALNSFLLLGVGALGNLLGGAIPEYVAGLLHVSAASTEPLRVGVLVAALFTLVFGLPLWLLREPRRTAKKSTVPVVATPENDSNHAAGVVDATVLPAKASAIQPAIQKERIPVWLFLKLLIPDVLFTMGEGAVVALIQIYFVLRFQLLPGSLGVIFTISGIIGGVFSLTSPLFVKRWSKLRLITSVQYISAPLMILIGFAPTLPLAVAGEYTRSFLRLLIDPVYAAFAMERVSDKHRATLAGLYSVTWSVGFSIGPTIGGWLQANVSLSTSFVFGAVCLILAPSLLLVFFGRTRK